MPKNALCRKENLHTPVILNGVCQEIDLVDNRELRNSLVENEAVFDDSRVKALAGFLLPKDFGATTEQVASYFEVGIETIQKVIQRNRTELAENGFKHFSKSEIQNGQAVQLASIPNRGINIFSRRAILNVAMLLRDSHVAKTIRSVLLDATENKTVVKEIVNQQQHKQAKVDTKAKEVEARLINAKVRQANIYLKIAEKVNIPTYKDICYSKATEVLNGEALLPLPKAERKTYSAAEIGEKLGITANKVGTLSNKHNLKTEEYGLTVWDKSKYSNKQVETFRYYENVIPVIEKLIEKGA